MISIQRRVQAIAVGSFLVALLAITLVSAGARDRITAAAARHTMEFVAGQIALRRAELSDYLRKAVFRVRTPDVVSLETALFSISSPGPAALQQQTQLGSHYRSVFIAEPAIRTITLVDRDRNLASSYRVAGGQFDLPAPTAPAVGSVVRSPAERLERYHRVGETIVLPFDVPFETEAPYLLLQFGVIAFSDLLVPRGRSRYPFRVISANGDLLLGEQFGDMDRTVAIPGTDWTLHYGSPPAGSSLGLSGVSGWDLLVLAGALLLGGVLFLRVRQRFLGELNQLIASLQQWDSTDMDQPLPRITARKPALPMLGQLLRSFAVFPLIPIACAIMMSLTVTLALSRAEIISSIDTQAEYLGASIRHIERRINSASAEVIFDPHVQESMATGSHEVTTHRVTGIMAGGVHRATWDALQSWKFTGQDGSQAMSPGQTSTLCPGAVPPDSGALEFACFDLSGGSLVYHRSVRSSLPGSLGKRVGSLTLAFDPTVLIERSHWAQPTPGGRLDILTPEGHSLSGVPSSVSVGVVPAGEGATIRYRYPVPDSRLILEASIPRQDIAFATWESIQAIALLLTLLAMVVLGALTWTSVVLSRPIVNMAQRIGTQNRIVELDETSEPISEVAMVTASFNALMDRLDHLIEENYRSRMKVIEEEALLREARLAGLEQQINPHFIFNTLEAMRQFSLEQEQPRLANYVTAMGRLFRYAVQTSSADSTIEEELAIAEDYVRLQEFRYETVFLKGWWLEDEVTRVPCLRFLIQPIIENSFVHGYDGIQPDFRITVRVVRRGKAIEMEISDNGRPQTLSSSPGYSVGMKNIRNRLNLRYGETATLTFESSNTGAHTLICFPVEEYSQACGCRDT